MKICGVCKKEKSESEFSKKKNGLNYACKTCHALYRREHYIKNRAEIIQRIAERQEELYQFILGYKVSHGCIICGESHPACLDFHHRDPSVKEINVTKAVERGWCVERIMREIEKCDVICSNCHRKLHWKRPVPVA